jgi:hypothetical protein
MQKLTWISSGKNNKSCRIIHNGSNKTGFVVLWFFYDFLRNLQEIGKSLLLFDLPFAERPSERFAALQCDPWAAGRRGGAKSGEARWSFGRGRTGKGLGATGTRFRRSGGAVVAKGRSAGGLRGTAVRCAPGARLRRALGQSSKGAARRDFSGVGRRGLGALETAESTVGKVNQRRAPMPTASSGGRGGAGCIAARDRDSL